VDSHAVLTGSAVAVSVVSLTRETLVHPLTIVYVPNTTKEHALNDYETTWQQLIDEITVLESVAEHDERAYLPMKQCIARLNLVQPFDWMQWQAPMLSEVDIDELSIDDCLRHITRLVRGDRFAENLLAGWIHEGYFRALCEVARREADGKPVPSLRKAA
jgi:hypothetical protein